MSLVANIQGLGKYVAYYPNLNHITGNVLASILLHELIFQTQYQADPAGVSIKEIKLMELTGFSQKELRSARARLTSKGLTVEIAKGLPKRNFYRVNSEVVDSLWREYQCTHLSAVSLAREEKKSRLQSVLIGLTCEDASVSPIRTHQSVLSGRTGESCQDASSESYQDALSYTSLKSLDKSLDKSLEEKDSRALECESESVSIADETEKGESQNFVLCLEIEEEDKVKAGGRNSKKKSSAAAPPKNSTSKPAAQPNLSDADCDRFVAAWNEAKPAHFIGMLALTDSKSGKLRKAIFESMVKESQSVDIAIAALQHYLRTSATDSYWSKYGFKPKFENLASNEKLDLAAQSYRISLEATPIAALSDSPEISDEPTFQPQANNATANYEKRFANPHKYPALIEAGHGDIMVGTGYLDFDPIVIEVAVLHLKKHELACAVGDGKRFISNRIKQADWAAIELLKESAATIAGDRQKTEAAIAASANSGSEYYDTSRYYIPEPPVIDLEARAKATEGGRAKMRETIAQALKNRAS